MNAKKTLLKIHKNSGTGHLGSALSCLDILRVLLSQIMGPDDYFILSKGHAVTALYAVLNSLGRLSDADLSTFAKDGTTFPMHPHVGTPSVLFSTGSLGHGPSLANGLALASRQKKAPRRVYCLCGDGEWQEGSCWEALIFAASHKLGNITFLIDSNGWQGLGTVGNVASGLELEKAFRAFPCLLTTADGHDDLEITSALGQNAPDMPAVTIFRTIKGKDLSFADTLASHYLPLPPEDYNRLAGTADA